MDYFKNLIGDKITKKSPPTEPPVIGDWVRISILGSGSFGIVSLWRCKKSDDYIAIKKCKLQCASSLKAKHKERWSNEVQIMKELDHPNIVKYKNLDPFLEKELMKSNPTKLPLLPMEYCQKGNLRHILTQPYNMCGLEEDKVRNILSDITSAVHYLHSKNITHRDIKPENIVLQDCPTKQIIYKLIDLGYAKELSDKTISFVGTLSYLAPEIFANTKYTHTVDYWSFGVMAFEIICGVIPFTPRLPAIERYHLIEGKKSEDICIFENHMGNLEFSPELFRENRISGCLKNLMEIWLRKALQFDPMKRAEPFFESRNFFDQLNFILKKKILNVFVINKYEFYSYEFDECTRLSTVRQWISRDTGILEDEQLLLGSFQFSDCNDQTLIANCFIDENYKLFLFKRYALFQVDKHYHPRLVKLMFSKANEKFSWYQLKRIYSHCIYYIQNDIHLASNFCKAMDLRLKQLIMMINKIVKSWELARNKLNNLSGKVTEFNNKIKNENLNCSDVQVSRKVVKVLDAIEKCVHVEHREANNIKRWQAKFAAMQKINLLNDIFKVPQIQELLEKAVKCFQKTASADVKDKLQCGEMLRIVSDVIKFKDSMYFNKNLENYSSYLDKAADYLNSLLPWMVSFDVHVVVLDELFDSVRVEAIDKYVNTGRASTSISLCATSKPSIVESAVEQTELLSSRFAELIGDSIASYRNIRDEIESYITDISSLL